MVHTVQRVLACYPVTINGKAEAVTPHDLRRTYARRLYDDGVPLVAIQQNLGHADVKTTLGYLHWRPGCGAAPPGEAYQFEGTRMMR